MAMLLAVGAVGVTDPDPNPFVNCDVMIQLLTVAHAPSYMDAGAIMSDDNLDWLDEIIAEIEADEAKRKLKRENPYALDLIRVLWPYGEKGWYRLDAIHAVWKRRDQTGVNMPKKFESTVQSDYNRHTSTSSVFSGKPEDDLFYPVGGKGSGRWAVHRDRAKAWLLQKRLKPF